jgi:hypothetical protein
VRPDILTFPDFDDNVRDAFRRETELLFSYIVREYRSALELLNADYTFLNERLARHYGIADVRGSYFRKVRLPAGSHRRGLLGHGSILTITSTASRTSPVIRGSWILENLLSSPVPAPPPGVETNIDGDGTQVITTSVRQRLEAHRTDPKCASCHNVFDPVGFALENFNPVGQWRTSDADGAPLDTGGVLADGSKVDGPAALRNVILSRPEAFTTTLTERIMTYALGRGVEPPDMAVIRRIVKNSAQRNYSLQSIISGIVESAPFQMRTRLEAEPTATRVANSGNGVTQTR